ncbi:MAG: Na/Pi cotransporter family protein [Tissierellia bacterium]|nr:Na/Pi cotransporter family protein [Tissierellia bacterium]
MNFFNFLSLIGGLALFLYGMDTMTSSLSNISGSQMKAIMKNLTSNKLKGVLLGAGITALIQSSSGTTVIVVGLVNSGIMTLKQAVSVIMGANVGTTITSWILSLTSLSGDSFIVQMFKPSSFSPIFAMIGVIFLITSHTERRIEIGKVLLGFSVLMYGMQTMSHSMGPLAEMPEFAGILTIFSNPILGIIAGAVITAIVQSSSASVGILQSLAATGIVNYATAMPIIMGQNIGTCATALLSTIGAKRNARRAAIIHLLFNMLGTALFMAGFYIINAIKPFTFMSSSINPVGIAIVHTLMNLITTAVLLPLSRLLVELATKFVPFTDEDYEERDLEFQRLDDRLLDSPSLALQQSFDLSVQMFAFSREALALSVELLEDFDKDKFKKVRSLENKVDRYEDKLGTYMVKITTKTLINKDSRLHTIILQCIGDFERIADHARNIAESAREMEEKKVDFSEQAKEELNIYSKAALDLVDETLQVYKTNDVVLASSVEPFEEVIDYMHDEMKARHVDRITEGSCSIEMGFILSDITTSLERIADHCSNIAVSVITVNAEVYETHRYLNHVSKDSEAFIREYKRNREKYQLPLKREYEKIKKEDKKSSKKSKGMSSKSKKSDKKGEKRKIDVEVKKMEVPF